MWIRWHFSVFWYYSTFVPHIAPDCSAANLVQKLRHNGCFLCMELAVFLVLTSVACAYERVYLRLTSDYLLPQQILGQFRAKLFRFKKDEKSWGDMGVGQLRLMKHTTNDGRRMVLRNDMGKVRFPAMILATACGVRSSCRWNAKVK